MAAAEASSMVVPAKEQRKELFLQLDTNGNGGLSLAEIDRAAKEGLLGKALGVADGQQQFNRNVLMRAYRAADASQDGFIEPTEFNKLLRYVVFFQGMWERFDEIDTDGDHKLDQEEFAKGCATLGLELSAEAAAAEFAQCDSDGGGCVLFEEFCSWAAKQSVGPELQQELAREAEEGSRQGRCAEQLREYLLLHEQGDHTEGVVRAFKDAQYPPEDWLKELQAIEKEGIMPKFVRAPCLALLPLMAAVGRPPSG